MEVEGEVDEAIARDFLPVILFPSQIWHVRIQPTGFAEQMAHPLLGLFVEIELEPLSIFESATLLICRMWLLLLRNS